MPIDHDQIFKNLIEAFFREFMELFCPDEAKLIDFEKVEVLRDEIFTDVPSGRRRHLDLVVKVGLKSGGDRCILVHTEFESRKEQNFPQRMFEYYCQLMAKMNYNRKERVRLKADFLRLILGAGVDPARQSLLVEFIETYMPLAGDEAVKFEKVVTTNKKYEQVETMITVYEARGMEEGKKEGKKEGKQRDLILLLEMKFGKLGADVKDKVRQIESTRKLESLLVSVLDARSLDDLKL